jgi:hypothetical protein
MRARLSVRLLDRGWVIRTALFVVVTACSNNWDALDPRLGDGATTTTGTGASAGAGGGGAGGAGGGGSGGEPPVEPPLTGDGLLARYYLDEAASGTAPDFVRDAATPPLDLGMQYNGPVSFVETDGHRGITWPSIGQNGGPAANIGGTKVYDLDGSTTGTIEVVLTLFEASVNGSRIVHIGTDDEKGRFTLLSDAPDAVAFYWQPSDAMTHVVAGVWPVDFPSMGRVVLHVVLDTNRPDEAERLRLFVDGALVDPVGGIPPASGEVIDFVLQNRLALGNRANGGRSFQGTLFYTAIYQSALPPEDIAANVAVLLGTDDHL